MDKEGAEEVMSQGGPAYPFQLPGHQKGTLDIFPGTTRLEYHAAKAMQGILANPEVVNAKDGWKKEEVSRLAIDQADELMKQLREYSAAQARKAEIMEP